MKKLSLLFVASAIAVGSAYACGGEEPAKNPNDVGSASATATSSGAPSATADMPSATASVTATASTPPPPPEPPPIAVDGIKVSGKGKDGKALAVEVKPDGGVMKDGKTLMAFPTQAEGGRSQMMVMVVDGDLASLLQGAGTGVPPG